MDDVPPDFFGWLFGRRGGPPAADADDRRYRRVRPTEPDAIWNL